MMNHPLVVEATATCLTETVRHYATLPGMGAEAIAKVAAVEKITAALEQVPITTCHLFHAGMYARTIRIPAGTFLTGALIKIPTVLIFNGDATIYRGDPDLPELRITGYCVLPGSAHRKQAFIAHADTDLTMLFPTSTNDVGTAEGEFTDESDILFSRRGENVVNITGE